MKNSRPGKNQIHEILDKNFMYVMIDFYGMQTEFMSSIIKEFKDIDKGYIIFFILSKLFKKINVTEKNYNDFKIKNNHLLIKDFKIIDLVDEMSVPKETIRRKIEELINDNFIKYDNKNIYINFNKDETINILKGHIKMSSKFISRFFFFYNSIKYTGTEYNNKNIEDKIFKNFEFNFNLFINFQVDYYKIWKNTMKDFNVILIYLLCLLNNLYIIKKKNPEKSKVNFNKSIITQFKHHERRGLNATSIAELSGIPRATVIRKLNLLLSNNLIIKDKNLLYTIKLDNNNFYHKTFKKKVPKVMDIISTFLFTSYKNF